ncbi:hypothetical protein ARMGADRAFT_670314 [Armillaria gallica]|uniref:Uncharacterized protein n=1 Tax=Armillaria gallica TaxID=47427 RepID=A0A2H3CK98_ARMGA|nr:hypothetical protein ARMGADRAFT_670314 [Armillaria gallica]
MAVFGTPFPSCHRARFLRLPSLAPFPSFYAMSRRGTIVCDPHIYISFSVGASFHLYACHFAHLPQISCSRECQDYRPSKLDCSGIQAPWRATHTSTLGPIDSEGVREFPRLIVTDACSPNQKRISVEARAVTRPRSSDCHATGNLFVS